MDRLEQIKNEVARENGRPNWDEMMYWDSSLGGFNKPHAIDDVARRYAKAVAEDALKRAADNAKILVSNGETHLDVKSYTLDDGIRFSPDYNRILSTPINTDL